MQTSRCQRSPQEEVKDTGVSREAANLLKPHCAGGCSGSSAGPTGGALMVLATAVNQNLIMVCWCYSNLVFNLLSFLWLVGGKQVNVSKAL